MKPSTDILLQYCMPTLELLSLLGINRRHDYRKTSCECFSFVHEDCGRLFNLMEKNALEKRNLQGMRASLSQCCYLMTSISA